MDFAALQSLIELEGARFLDVKVPDLAGRLHHVTLPAQALTERLLEEGVGFDGSSYGFSPVESSDMVVRPDLTTCFRDPFRTTPTIACLGTIHLTDAARTPFPEDPRLIARRAEERLCGLGIADRSLWGPEYEFYVFRSFTQEEELGRMETRIEPLERIAGRAYHAETPDDRLADFRGAVCLLLEDLGVPVKYHHHEGGGWGQNEIETLFEPLGRAADHAVLIPYILKNRATQDGLALTLMPKPLYAQAGNGWHVHLFLQKEGRNAFFDEADPYARLSPLAFLFMGGILRHARALCAFTNPSTNSYKRLVPGFEAPVTLTFGRANRSSAIRIPLYVSQESEIRFEYRPPDATSNPYFCLAALLQAGIDGVRQGIDARSCGFGPYERDLFQSDSGQLLSFLPTSLEEALNELEADHSFLLEGNVFPASLLKRWLETKRKEARAVADRPHPYELKLYF
ncbi:MAG: glutamine synthetase beta-grasp domain-containing protein [bacterium]